MQCLCITLEVRLLRYVCSSRSIGRREVSSSLGHWGSAGSMPADTHLFEVFESNLPGLLRPTPISSAVFWHLVVVKCTLYLYNFRSNAH